ncbi:hypothetical protein Q9L58_007828 [Maublancomyces gigas]|uniref:F-box domain-containing protein n=1 Tax=Discina gigas TaxID=1032678 RepID=A0ABR3GBI9_9PEZI
MAALDQLPYETLTQILAGLSIADLNHTSLVSRTLATISEPLLYEAPSLSALRTSKHRSSLERFLRNLVGPRGHILGAQVRSLSVRWDHCSWQDTVTYTGTGWSIGFLRPAGFHGTHCVLLMHLLPSVLVLRISPPRDIPLLSQSYITHCLDPMDPAPHASASRPTLQLQSLREFSCPHERDRGGISFGALLALMKLPSIRSIDTHIVYIPTFIPPPSSNDSARFSSVTRLWLSTQTMSIPSLSFFLSAPVALTSFSYQLLSYSGFRMVDLMDILSPLRPSLHHLHLDLISAAISFTGGKDDCIRSSFRDWPVLQTLSCSLVELLGTTNPDVLPLLCLSEVLPHSLRGLNILPDHYWVHEAAVHMVGDLLRQKEEAVPALERLALGVTWDYNVDADAELQLACMSAGVGLVEGDVFVW